MVKYICSEYRSELHKNSDKAVAIFSLEMGAESLVELYASAEGLIHPIIMSEPESS